MKKVYLFDFDGTLVNTMEGFADIAGTVIHKYHPEMSYAEARHRYIESSGVPFVQQMEIIYPNHPTNAEVVREFEETKIEGFFEQHFEDDVRYTIQKLRAQGFMVGVSSGNFPHLIAEFVKREALEFDIVMGFDAEQNFEKGKPHFDHVINHCDVSKNEIMFVGDSLKDADKAYDNGIDFIGVCGLFTSQDFEKRYAGVKTIQNLRELVD